MSWIWLIVVFLFGFGTGTIVMFLLSKNSINSTEINTRKIQQKKNTGSRQDVSTVLTRIKDRTTWFEKRKAKRALKRANK